MAAHLPHTLRLLAASLLIAHGAAYAMDAERSFNTSEFAGLAAQEVGAYEDAALDVSLKRSNGKRIKFTRCKQVESAKERSIAKAQQQQFRLLVLNCAGLKQYAASKPAKRSFFPPQLTREVVAAFPATAVVPYDDEEMARRKGKTLYSYEKHFKVSVELDDSAKVQTADDKMNYVVMARGDFDSDGLEDILVRVDSKTRTAAGKDTDLVLLSQKSGLAAITVTWRP